MAKSNGFGSLMTLALVGGGLYLLVKNTKLPYFFPEVPGPGETAVPPPVSTTPAPSTTPASTAPVVNQPTPSTAPAATTDRDAIARLAAAGNASAVAQAEQLGIRYNADQWNWLRAAGGGGQTTTDLFPPEDRGYQMGAMEYLSRRQAAGLSGVGGWGVRS